MPVSNFFSLTIFLYYERKPFQIFGQFRALFKETNVKNIGLRVQKYGEKT